MWHRHMRMSDAGISLFYRWIPRVGPMQPSLTRLNQAETAASAPTPIQSRNFHGRRRKARKKACKTRRRKSATSREVREAKALWRAGTVSKPEYVQFCNQIHLLDLQVSKGDMDGGVARRARQALLVDLVGCRAKSAAHKEPKQRTGAQTIRSRAPARMPPSTGYRPNKLPRPARRRQHGGRIIPGGVRMRKHHNKWQRLRRKRWDRLLNNKRDAASVAEGAAELHPTTQRLIPAPRKRKGRRILRGQ